MPTVLSYPGVHIEEVPSGVRTITGVPTSIAAFVGRASRGPVNKAITINEFGDFERVFGGLWLQSQLGFAVHDFFLNGGGQAIIVRLFGELSDLERGKIQDAADAVADAAVGADAPAAQVAAEAVAVTYSIDPEKSAAKAVLDAVEGEAAKDGATVEKVTVAAKAAALTAVPVSIAVFRVGGLALVAASEGRWGANLRISIDFEGIPLGSADDPGIDRFNLTIRDAGSGGSTERFANLTIGESARRINRVLKTESTLLGWSGDLNAQAEEEMLGSLLTAQTAQRALDKAKEVLNAEDENSPATEFEKAVEDVNKAQIAADIAMLDTVSQKENTLVDKKKRLTLALVSGVEDTINAAKTNLTAAQTDVDAAEKKAFDAVSDGRGLKATDFVPTNGEVGKIGLYALEQADLFNLLCIPPYTSQDADTCDVDNVVVSAATAYCEKRRAIHLIDPPPDWKSMDAAKNGITIFPEARSKNAALYFPRLMQPNLLRENRIETFAPCGTVAGVIARTDKQRGVWKAAAGLDATLAGVPQLSVNLTDAENGELNPLGINCLRAFAVAGRVVWGSRTLRGADQLADEWKYLPVRRTALFIEESLYRGTQCVVYEPNDEPLWSQIRLNVGAFMHGLFRRGAFQGQSPRDSYFVKCDKETTTQTDIDSGIVNIAVGFAPLKPAEFVVIRLQQIAGQIQT